MNYIKGTMPKGLLTKGRISSNMITPGYEYWDDAQLFHTIDDYTLLKDLGNGKAIWKHYNYITGSGSDIYIETNDDRLVGYPVSDNILNKE